MAYSRDRRRTPALALFAAVGLVAVSAASARADELRVESAQTAATDVPARGMTMDTVQSRFGSPSQKLAAVGDPPITRWEYPSYVVYFEYQHVIHSVLKHNAS
jgi:hypothetical protein